MNTDALLAAIEKIYTCIDGPPRAWFEIHFGALLPKDYQGLTSVRIVYHVVRASMVGSAEATASVLFGWAYLKLRERLTDEMVEDRMALFWRTKPALMEFVDEKGRICTQIRMRLAIPSVSLDDITVEEGGFPRWL